MTHSCYGCGCEVAGLREALVMLLVAAEHQRDVSPGAQPQLLAAIDVAKQVLQGAD